jgi:hypothetical protein
MIIKNVKIMSIGETINGFEITKDMIEKSIDTFPNAPVVWNKEQELRDYTNDIDIQIFNESHTIGIVGSGNIVIKDDGVYADLIIADWHMNKWKNKCDNWMIQLEDDKQSFKFCSVEVF